MTLVSRRNALIGGAVIPFTQWFASEAQAATLVRRDLTTAAGAANLAKYAQAVKLMMARAESDPRGWMFQWYIHTVRGDRTKAAELARVYPLPGPQKTLATASWSTCQAHASGTVEDYFLPWHRMYVFFLEGICRKLLNDPTFVLPYWRYTQPAQRALPIRFRQPSSTLWGPLYRANRWTAVNSGAAIDQSLFPTPINTSSLQQTSYRPTGGQQGFCLGIDANLHGSVHVQIGNSLGMGSPPWAANDPIFWMHHCNIDRMWASWNKNGGCNPTDTTWLNKTFTFPDINGNSVIAKVSDFKSVGPLGYIYDTYEPGPLVGNCPGSQFQFQRMAHLAILERPVKLDPVGPVEVTLDLPSAELQRGDRTPGQGVAPASGRLWLIIENLQARLQPGVLYNIGIRDGVGGKSRTVGQINFFDAVSAEHGDHDHGPGAMGPPPVKFFSFDVSGLVKRSGGPVITVTPAGRAAAEAEPVINGFRLVMG